MFHIIGKRQKNNHSKPSTLYWSNIGFCDILFTSIKLEETQITRHLAHVACQMPVVNHDLQNGLISCPIIYQTRVPFNSTFIFLLLQVFIVVVVFSNLNKFPHPPPPLPAPRTTSNQVCEQESSTTLKCVLVRVGTPSPHELS